ncbi:MAG: MFS transporter [Anaerolineae bacterium]
MSPIDGYWARVRGLQQNARRYLGCTVLFATTTSLHSLIYNLYLIQIGYDAGFIGFTSAVLSATRLVFALPAGMVADRIGRKRSMLIGLAGMAVAQFGLSLLTADWAILGSMAISGVFGALFMTSVAPFLTEHSSPDQRSLLFTLDSSLTNLASFFASTAGGYLPLLFGALLHVDGESAPAYRGVMLVSACTLALALLPIATLTESPRTSSRRRVPWTLRALRKLPNGKLMVRLVLPRALMAFGAGLVFPFLNLYFKERFAVSDATLGWIFGITNVVAAAAMLWGGTVAERMGKVRTMLLARLLSVPGLLVLGFVPSLAFVAVAHWIRSALMRLGDPLYMAFAMEQLSEDDRATGSSLLSTGWNVGWSGGPYVSGLLQPRVGWGPLFGGTIVFYVASLALVYAFFVRGQEVESLAGERPLEVAGP